MVTSKLSFGVVARRRAPQRLGYITWEVVVSGFCARMRPARARHQPSTRQPAASQPQPELLMLNCIWASSRVVARTNALEISSDG